MTDKKMRRLSKTELLWIIRDQEAEILELKERLAQYEPLEDETEYDGDGERETDTDGGAWEDKGIAEVEADDESGKTDS